MTRARTLPTKKAPPPTKQASAKPAGVSKAKSKGKSKGKGGPMTAARVAKLRKLLGATSWPPTNAKITPFRSRVYSLCAQVPVGSVTTYAAIAKALGSAPRAVGGALRHNPLAPLPVPCHRVVASSRRLGGFAGTDSASDVRLSMKRAMLTGEGVPFEPADPDRVASAALFDAFVVDPDADAARFVNVHPATPATTSTTSTTSAPSSQSAL